MALQMPRRAIRSSRSTASLRSSWDRSVQKVQTVQSLRFVQNVNGFQNRARNFHVSGILETSNRITLLDEVLGKIKHEPWIATVRPRVKWGLAESMRSGRSLEGWVPGIDGILLYPKELESTPAMREWVFLDGGIS